MSALTKLDFYVHKLKVSVLKLTISNISSFSAEAAERVLGAGAAVVAVAIGGVEARVLARRGSTSLGASRKYEFLPVVEMRVLARRGSASFGRRGSSPS